MGRPKTRHSGRTAIYDHVKIKEMTKQGKSGEEIAEAVGCSVRYVYYLRYKKRFGVKI
jgi:hypothetical protein